MTVTFGDGIDWAHEARRADAADQAAGGVPDHSEFLSRLKGPGKVLDAGCNIGRYCPALMAAGFKYTGVDQSAEAIAIARQRNPKGVFIREFLWDMEFSKPFDAAISFAVLQHNTLTEKKRILPRISAALKGGGQFAMIESTVLTETKTQLTQAGWIKLVEDHGFELVETWHPNPEYGIDDAYLFRRLL